MSSHEAAGRPWLHAVPAIGAVSFVGAWPGSAPPLVGRDQELETLSALLRDQEIRVLTLTGTGGVGKTRLAIEAAGRASDRDAALFVSLAAITNPELVIPEIARVAGRSDDADADALGTLADLFGGLRVLLVLDNLEHLISAAASLVGLLDRCRGVTVLATSRRAMRIQAEHEFAVEPLSVPAGRDRSTLEVARADSVRLLVQTAERFDPSMELTTGNVGAISDICIRLDGLPLAIELAAARLRVLAPAELASLLGQRLDVLGSGRDGAPHQRTLRATIEWSYQLLSPIDQRTFLCCATFSGGFGIEGLTAVTASEVVSVVGSLETLVDVHLVRTVAGRADVRRFDLLDTIRAFAVEKLGALDDQRIRDAHGRWATAVAARAAADLTGPEAPAALDRLDLEHDNLRAALNWLVADAASDRALALAAALWRFWWIRGHAHEGRAWLQRALDAYAGGPAPAQANAHHAAGELAEEQSDYVDALTHFEQALALRVALDDTAGVAECWNSIGLVARVLGDTDRAESLHKQALEALRAQGDRRGVAVSLNNLAAIAYFRGDLTVAVRRWEEAIEAVRSIGDQRSVGLLLGNVGAVRLAQGDGPGAIAAHEESVSIARVLGDVPGTAHGLGNLGEALVENGDAERAADVLDEALTMSRDLGERSVEATILHTRGRLKARGGDHTGAAADWASALRVFVELGTIDGGAAATLEHLAQLANTIGDPGTAATFLGTAQAFRAIDGTTALGVEADAVAAAREAAASALEPDAFASAWTAGSTSTLGDASVLANAFARAVASTPPAVPAAAAQAHRQAGLTVREFEIATYLARRRTDPEIAAILSISPRTVTSHVSAVLRKLGVPSRRDVAAALHDLGIDLP